jgi:sigma-B regulation protein RsbU (phosphoserine phosphatase)
MIEQNPIINLEAILDFSSKLNDTFDYNFILSSAALSIMGKLKVSKITAFINKKGQFEQVLSKGVNEHFDNLHFHFENNFYRIPQDSGEYYPLLKAGLHYLIPLKHHNQISAVIAFSKSLLGRNFTEQEVEYTKIIASITAASLINASNFEKLLSEKNTADKKSLLLATLMEISQDFTVFSSTMQIFKLFSLHLMGHLLTNKYAVFLKDPNQEFTEIINRFDKDVPTSFLRSLESITNVTKSEELGSKIPIDLKDCCISAVAPMKYQNEIKGYVLIGKRYDNSSLSDENLLFIEVLSNTLTGALENYRLFQEEIKKEKIENELNLALEIQKNLLPHENPKIEGYDIFGVSQPSRAVGGDYYDFIQINKDEFLIVIADVSGKGVPAALLMANLQAAIRTLAPLDLDLNRMLININSILYQNTTSDKFVTLFLAKLNSEEDSIEYINAGHNPPLLINSQKKIRELVEGGIVLGILSDIPLFHQDKIYLSHVDKLLFYTDGISEAMNSQKQEFGTDRLENFIYNDQSQSAKDMAENLLAKVDQFVGNAEQHDDITLITLIKK